MPSVQAALYDWFHSENVLPLLAEALEVTTWLPGEKYPDELVSDTTNVKGGKIEHTIKEKNLLHIGCNKDKFGFVNIDADPQHNPDIVCDFLRDGIMGSDMFQNDEFEACFWDFPWVGNWMQNTSTAIKKMLRVAPVAYVMSPWLYGASWCRPTDIKVSWRPGVNKPILFVRYVRNKE